MKDSFADASSQNDDLHLQIPHKAVRLYVQISFFSLAKIFKATPMSALMLIFHKTNKHESAVICNVISVDMPASNESVNFSRNP